MAGMLLLKLYFHETHREGKFNPSRYDSWNKKPPKRLEVFNIRAYIYQAESLPPCDDTGASDPYIEVWNPYKE